MRFNGLQFQRIMRYQTTLDNWRQDTLGLASRRIRISLPASDAGNAPESIPSAMAIL